MLSATVLGLYATLWTVVEAGPYASLRYMFYIDRDHHHELPGPDETRLATHAILAHESPALFVGGDSLAPEPFVPLKTVREAFAEPNAKVCFSVGASGKDAFAAFWKAAESEESRSSFAQNIKKTVDAHGYDCVELAFSFPGGSGEGYTLLPQSSSSVATSAAKATALLKTVKRAVGASKEVSIVVPGREDDMLLFTPDTVPAMARAVDHVMVKAFDLNDARRDSVSNHSSGFHAVGEAMQRYLDRGVPSIKLDIGSPYYATWRRTQEEVFCVISAAGCPLVVGDGENNTGTVTFERRNFVQAVPAGLDPVVARSFKTAMTLGHLDLDLGGWWYWDRENRLWWSWETADTIYNKCLKYVPELGIGGIAAYAAGMDSNDWRRMVKTASGVAWIPGDFFADLEVDFMAKGALTHDEL